MPARKLEQDNRDAYRLPAGRLQDPLRRLAVIVACIAFVGLGGYSLTADSRPSRPPIVAENLNTGSSDWRIGRGQHRTADDVGLQVKGYASATRVGAGQEITFFASVQPAQALKFDIYRLGWYGGSGGRLMLGGGWLPGLAQPACPIDTTI